MEAFGNNGPFAILGMRGHRLPHLARVACLESGMSLSPSDHSLGLELVRAQLLATAEEGDGIKAPLSISGAMLETQKILVGGHTDKAKAVLNGYAKWLCIRHDNVTAGRLGIA